MDRIAAEMLELQNHIPNLSHPDAPVGVDDKANLTVRMSKADKPEFFWGDDVIGLWDDGGCFAASFVLCSSSRPPVALRAGVA